jgi:hypothetical protein
MKGSNYVYEKRSIAFLTRIENQSNAIKGMIVVYHLIILQYKLSHT